jgi:hypothetical protein
MKSAGDASFTLMSRAFCSGNRSQQGVIVRPNHQIDVDGRRSRQEFQLRSRE